jgi:glucokinase
VNAAPNIPTLEGFSFKKALAKTIDVPVLAHNDVNAALYGEHKFGAAVGCKHVIGIFIGTGIGGAILIDGKLYLGASGLAISGITCCSLLDRSRDRPVKGYWMMWRAALR